MARCRYSHSVLYCTWGHCHIESALKNIVWVCCTSRRLFERAFLLPADVQRGTSTPPFLRFIERLHLEGLLASAHHSLTPWLCEPSSASPAPDTHISDAVIRCGWHRAETYHRLLWTNNCRARQHRRCRQRTAMIWNPASPNLAFYHLRHHRSGTIKGKIKRKDFNTPSNRNCIQVCKGIKGSSQVVAFSQLTHTNTPYITPLLRRESLDVVQHVNVCLCQGLFVCTEKRLSWFSQGHFQTQGKIM